MVPPAMTTPAPADAPLADYLRVLRQRRRLIVLVALVCGVAALAVSLAQKPSYDATASLAVNDPNQDLSLLGTALVTNETPLQLASVHAPQVTRPEVVRRVKASLHSPLSAAALKQSVTVGIDPNSFLVTITGQSPHAAQAAAIANAFAKADVALTTAEAQRAYAAAATSLARRLRHLPAAAQPGTKAIYTDKLSELQSLSSIATPVQVSGSATTPTAVSSPKTARNTVAALLFGLLLGIALAYGREALDRRLRDPKDVERHFDQPVLGRIRAEALGRARVEPEGGANGANGANGTGLADIDAESFRILRHNVRYLAPGDGARTLLVTSAIAQEGKSTIAACLAMASAQAGIRTLLIECDLRRPVLASRLGLEPEPGLADYLAGRATPKEVLQMVAPASAKTNGNHAGPTPADAAPLVCITAGTTASRPADLLASARFRTLLSEVSEVYESVILDSAPLLSVADTLEIVPHVSAVLLCVRLSQTTHQQAGATRAALDRLPARPTGLVVTGVTDAEGDYVGSYAATQRQPGRGRLSLRA
jgi:capsular exopolysaccharide synthesis family protein